MTHITPCPGQGSSGSRRPLPELPGRDPRPAFRTARFAEGVRWFSDLRPGVLLEGQVTNVAAFGVFVVR